MLTSCLWFVSCIVCACEMVFNRIVRGDTSDVVRVLFDIDTVHPEHRVDVMIKYQVFCDAFKLYEIV
jgi:hypothetical protein